MARGTPDGRITDLEYASQVVDPAATPNQLYGFSPIDGQGRVVYLDTFNNGLGGVSIGFTGGGILPSIDVTNGRVFVPPTCLLLNPGTTFNDYAQAYRSLYFAKNRKLGFEAGFDFDLGQQWFFRLENKPIDGSDYVAELKYDHASGDWQIHDTSGWVSILHTGALPIGSYELLQIKMVADWSTGEYVRAFIGDDGFDISAYTMPTGSATFDGFGTALARVISWGGPSNNEGRLGYILVTKDEP